MIESKERMDLQEETACPVCGGMRIISDNVTGERVCGECGRVLNVTEMDTGPEYRAFNLQEANDRRRTGTGYSYSIYDKGLSTVI
ncbi:transcription initiation factor IIB, partial [Candidatus Bathyarchaeota archaeon]